MGSANVQVTPRLVQNMQETCHDMRQPVASVFALAAVALAEPGLPEAARARLEQIVQQAEWLADLIQHSLRSDGSYAPVVCQTDLVRVANEAVAAECMTWPGKVRVLSSGRTVHTSVHPALLRRMIANLLGNATRAAGPSGTVIVEAGCEQDSVLLSVEDSGPGFGKIQKGSGLGLAAVSRNATRHGGRLEYGSGANGGARVRLWLPRAPRESPTLSANGEDCRGSTEPGTSWRRG